MVIIKEMKYTTEKTREIIAKGEILGFEWYVVSYGTHPCCYIKIPEGHDYFGLDYHEIDDLFDYPVNCHGGLTFSDDHLLDLEEGWYIGWDYAHLGDYHPLIEPFGTKYSVSVLIAEVTEVICDL